MIIEKPMKQFLVISFSVIVLITSIIYYVYNEDKNEVKTDISKQLIYIEGEKIILDDLRVNVEYLKGDSSHEVYTVFDKNIGYPDNIESIHFTFYINYNHKNYATFGVDSLSHALGYKNNKIYLSFFEKNKKIYYCYSRAVIKSCEENKIFLTDIRDVSNHYKLFKPYVN